MLSKTDSKIEQTLQRLLEQYDAYQRAPDASQKALIGDAMKYDTPTIWILYKQRAYADTDHAIQTLHDLKVHSVDHGGICAKRFTFLQRALRELCGIDVLDPTVCSPDTLLDDFVRMDCISALHASAPHMEQWRVHEYYTVDGRVAKWEEYAI